MIAGRAEVLVLGAGLQGTGAALELARRGVAVTLLDQDERPLNRASLRNEGKIHLGFIYAADPTRATAFRQLDGALRFRAALARWLEGEPDWLSRSAPFHYLVANDSIPAPAVYVAGSASGADHDPVQPRRWPDLRRLRGSASDPHPVGAVGVAGPRPAWPVRGQPGGR